VISPSWGISDVTKKEIVKTISDKHQLTQLKTKEIVQSTFEAIIETLVEEHRIELRNFGVFEVKKRAARKARNPRTGERVDVAEKYVVTFKPGKEMEERSCVWNRKRLLVRPKACLRRMSRRSIPTATLETATIRRTTSEFFPPRGAEGFAESQVAMFRRPP
jgi:nucleoid DNA-binding protein